MHENSFAAYSGTLISQALESVDASIFDVAFFVFEVMGLNF